MGEGLNASHATLRVQIGEFGLANHHSINEFSEDKTEEIQVGVYAAHAGPFRYCELCSTSCSSSSASHVCLPSACQEANQNQQEFLQGLRLN